MLYLKISRCSPLLQASKSKGAEQSLSRLLASSPKRVADVHDFAWSRQLWGAAAARCLRIMAVLLAAILVRTRPTTRTRPNGGLQLHPSRVRPTVGF